MGINDVRIAVRKTGVCGTDLHIESWDPWAAKTIKPPLVVGHEFVGTVLEIGSNVTDLQIGDTVSAMSILVPSFRIRTVSAKSTRSCNSATS